MRKIAKHLVTYWVIYSTLAMFAVGTIIWVSDTTACCAKIARIEADELIDDKKMMRMDYHLEMIIYKLGMKPLPRVQEYPDDGE